MQPETVSSLIEHGASAIGALLKEELVHRHRMEGQAKQKEKEIELAKIQQEVAQERSAQPEPEPVEAPDPGATPAEVSHALDQLIAEEMCSTCQQLLRGLKDRPVDQQVRGIMEYGQFKRELSDEAGVDELRALIQRTTVLKSVLEENLRPAG